MTRAVALLCVGLLGCGGGAAEGTVEAKASVEAEAPVPAKPAAEATPVDAEAPVGTPPAAAKDCSVELKEGDGWTERARIPCPGSSVGLLVMGDVGYANPILSGSARGASVVCADKGCDLQLLAGDLLYGPGAAAEKHWAAIWDDTLAKVGVPTVAVLGNHEWRHEPDPALKRVAVAASDGRAGLISPSPSFAVRVAKDGVPLLAIAALDTDSVANPGPEMPGLGEAALDATCGLGVPVVALGHHPPSSQGLHHGHEAHVEKALRDTFAARRAAGCDLRLVVAGHDHDLQSYPPACEQPDVPALIVSGVAGRGFRKAGPPHLPTCGPGPSEGRATTYIAGMGERGGFVHVELNLAGPSEATLYATDSAGAAELLATTSL